MKTVLIVGSSLMVFSLLPCLAETLSIDLVPVDKNAIGPGTFQSNNQKVLKNSAGIFMTQIRSRNEAYDAQCWRLLRSVDGGETFSIVYEATGATNPPVIETDDEANIFLMHPDWRSGTSYLYLFHSKDHFLEPTISEYQKGATGKYAMEIDAARGQIYYFAIDNRFRVVGLDGQLRSTIKLTKSGQNGIIQYPHLYLDEKGILYAAWTTQKHGVYLYWDIHIMKSHDGGETWKTLKGESVEIPVVADDGGIADQISIDDEFEVHTWLANFVPKDGKLHFFYMSQFEQPFMRYARYDIESGEADIPPTKGFPGAETEIMNLDGFFAFDAGLENGPLYCTSRSGNRIVCISSDDNGETWYDYAISEPVTNPYAIGGCQQITEDNRIIGSFTDQGSNGASSTVYFLGIEAGKSKVEIGALSSTDSYHRLNFEQVRGQPESVRFRSGDGVWGDWMGFEEEMELSLLPSEFELKSRMGVVVGPFGMGPSTQK